MKHKLHLIADDLESDAPLSWLEDDLSDLEQVLDSHARFQQYLAERPEK